MPRYASRTWRTQDGLPENRVQAIAQTADGYLWVGTSGGLARFDGVRFVEYARFNTPSMTDDNIRSLAVAKDDSLWAATDGGGLLHYKNGSFQSFGIKDGLANEFINAVLVDHQGAIWAATQRGLYRSDGTRFKRVDESLHLINISFSALVEDSENHLVAAGPSGLFRFTDGTLTHYVTTADFGEVYRVQRTEDGSLWLATSRGVKRIPKSDGRTSFPVQEHTKTLVDAITQDHTGNVWLGSRGDGLFVVPGTGGAAFHAEIVLPDNSIATIFEDRDQSIWVGTADGLVRLSTPDVQIVNSRDGLSDDNVATIYSDHRRVLWLTTITGRVYRYVHGHAEPFQLLPPANNLQVMGTYEDHTGALWFGTVNAGVVRIFKGKSSRLTMAEGLRNNGIQAFFEDTAGNLWIGTSSGISKWDGRRITNYYLEDGLSYGWIRAIAEDQKGDLLIGTDRGLNRFHAGKFVHDDAFTQLGHDRIWSMLPDAGNTIWIGTRGAGLVRIKDGKVTRITTREGLLSNSIFQIIGGGDRLWMSGPSGLSSASFADLNLVAERRSNLAPVLSYSGADGVEPAQMNGNFQPSGCVAADGELWFPSVRGAVHLNPKHPPSSHSLPVRLESFFVDDQSVHPSKELVVSPGRRRIEINFTSVALRAPEQVSFSYQLEGFDGWWTAANHRRTANYDNLPPGRYRFRVVARNPEGSSEAGIDLIVQPYFYQTVWFYGLGFVFVALCSAGMLFLRERQARNRYHLRLEERTRIAREMHDTVIQGCLGVSTLVEAAASCAASDQDQMLECLDNARMHLRLTVDEARQALSDLRHDSFDGGLEEALSVLAQTLSSEKGIPISLEIDGASVRLPAATNRALVLVAREAIRNAVGHGAPSSVQVKLSFEQSDVRLEIHDDGCGFDLDSLYLEQSAHFGILGMRERLEQIGGSFEIETSAGSGTTISASVPLRTSVLTKA
ncbi:MAG TPA: two-component regulator propeller domain-containing protein [Bryobacteraceae bacterium]|jgi:signal transduction histidine kinase/ligand-binding sensor domain-containing protein|nr:two-component regulator propeller domain-containing protein [Bryobacteraceae bacterium]